ncbi:MAG: SDR family oxidoreductase [Candidatus Abyssobacteria bacterium SURF_5]|uniref:SDR family oxidoreductase n=1 Tax=Abyssobacteria bacterium (strain SURF_5) TaxID=2093360 RepID=A0A3A4N2C4_ABYX5|nr:MAG: SDR family oxidoreductase [Candidatus Abyssubacteria bacterium SURF_5]
MGSIDLRKLKGKVALVTGAARGLGRRYALRLAMFGADVVINDVNLDSAREFGEELTAESVMAEIEAYKVRSLGIECNVGDKTAVERMVAKVIAEFGRIDILINNAGGLAGQVFESFASSVSETDLRATIDRNLMGTIYCSQAASVPMKEQRSGKIINVASQAGLQAQPGGVYASYGAAKAGIIRYTSYLAQELGPYNITVNCIAPAYIETARLREIAFKHDAIRQNVLAQVPLGRLGTEDDCAKVAVDFLCTDLADYVTGQTISICGGAIKF